jgi:tRNA(fMet)-specific endonuclease VapC
VTRYLLDTDTLFALVRDPRGPVARRIADVGEEHVATSVVVAGELRFGAARSGSAALLARVDALLSMVPVLVLDDRVGRAYAEVRRALEVAGTPIGPNDLWIAAHAVAEARTVVTGNGREFARVPGLAVVDWR